MNGSLKHEQAQITTGTCQKNNDHPKHLLKINE